MTKPMSGAAAEWRQHYMLPIAAALGYATSVIHIYGLGSFIGPISAEFGWSRMQTTAGLTVATLVQAAFGIPIGMMLDRIGPRVFGVVGIVVTLAGFTLLGTATGDPANWYLLWGVMAFATLPVQATIWTSAVATRFEASRGLAFAVTLCGASVAAALFPYLATKLIAAYGWRHALGAQAAIWLAIAFPIIFLFFRGAHDKPARQSDAKASTERHDTGIQFMAGLRSSIYVRLLLASLLFTFPTIALVIHFVPILTGNGFDALTAAGIAALIGLSSIAGRLGTGALLDHFRPSLVGAGAFLLPAGGCLLLLLAGGNHAAVLGAACLIGLAVGAEMDVIVYLTTRHFGLKSFGALFGGLLAAISISVASGPLGASYVFDRYGNYTPFLWLAIVLMAASSIALASLPRPAFDPRQP
ncbi:MAG: MFS transporter [Sphingomonadales bacterium]|nr:MAG: MFS transporter [Sphingomonadales bacterium]